MGYYGKVKPATLEYYRKPLNFDKKFYGTPGAGLDSSGLNADRVQAGQKGEKIVGEELERIASLYPNMYVFHSVKLYGSTADIDHVIVQGKKVLLVDTKNWAQNHKYEVTTLYNGGDGYDENGQVIVGFVPTRPDKEYIVKRDGYNFKGGNIHLPFYMKKWDENLKKVLNFPKMDPVSSVLVIANDAEAVQGPGFDKSFFFSNVRRLEHVFQQVFAEGDVPPIHKNVLRFFVDRVQSSLSVEEAKNAPEEKYFAYQVDAQPGSKASTAMVWAVLVGLVGGIFHWWTFIIAMCIFALVSAALVIFVQNPRREPSYRKRTGIMKFLTIPVLFFLVTALISAMK